MACHQAYRSELDIVFRGLSKIAQQEGGKTDSLKLDYCQVVVAPTSSPSAVEAEAGGAL